MGIKELNADLDNILKQQHIAEGAAAERKRLREKVGNLFDTLLLANANGMDQEAWTELALQQVGEVLNC